MTGHIVDNPPDPDFLDYGTPGNDVCINYPDCDNRVPENGQLCTECLDEARDRERQLRLDWEQNVDSVRSEYDDFIEYREAIYENVAT